MEVEENMNDTMLSRDEKLAQRRQETYDSLLRNLESYGVCNVERCCMRVDTRKRYRSMSAVNI